MAETKHSKLTADTKDAETPREHPAFSFPIVKKFTGKIQFRTNGPAQALTPFGDVQRGAVLEVRKQSTAESLVENGQFAHVPADTPIGQPEEFSAKAMREKAEPSAASKLASKVKTGAANLAAKVKGEHSADTEPKSDDTK